MSGVASDKELYPIPEYYVSCKFNPSTWKYIVSLFIEEDGSLKPLFSDELTLGQDMVYAFTEKRTLVPFDSFDFFKSFSDKYVEKRYTIFVKTKRLKATSTKVPVYLIQREDTYKLDGSQLLWGPQTLKFTSYVIPGEDPVKAERV